MTEEELKLAYRITCAVEKIAESFNTIAACMSNGGASEAPAAKRPAGRPRKEPAAPAEPVEPAAIPDRKPDPVSTAPEPTEEERKAGFALLKTSLQNCLALHGEEETRTRLKHPKFSEVPYSEIAATIKRLDA